ncbi:MAG: CDP-glucose 4,6-dehydratase [Caldisericia bacterium]|nr:CDP-glucose 4,6-dehydratase [Caldisericia bacterium]MDD4614162.1 CDP-glucose 4,6-dehydratase [Caldisericia bacterium]
MQDKHKLSTFYHGKRVFVTGHTGFKGSWLCQWLVTMGADVMGYSIDIPTKPSLFEVLQLPTQLQDIRGDVRDFDTLQKAIQSFQPQVLFHLAAQPIVRDSYKNPIETFETNVMGSIYIMECIRQLMKTQPAFPLESVVMVTSDKCYENQNQVMGYRENDPMGGHDPYSASKGCMEMAVSSYQKSFFQKSPIGIATVRAGNVIGGGDWGKDRLLPDIAKAFSVSQAVTLRNPLSVRPWQHVLEPLSGYLLVGKCLAEDPASFSEGWNLGPLETDIATVEDVVKKCIQVWPTNTYDVQQDDSLHETSILQLDVHKAIAKLHWKPTWTLNEAIEKTIQWYKTFYEKGSKASKVETNQQILDYMNV